MAWNTFDLDILGARYDGHIGKKTGDLSQECRWDESTMGDSAFRSFEQLKPFLIATNIYRYEDLSPDVDVLLWAKHVDGDAEYPVAWTNEVGGKRVFYTSIGDVEEMALPHVQSLLRSAVLWALGEG